MFEFIKSSFIKLYESLKLEFLLSLLISSLFVRILVILDILSINSLGVLLPVFFFVVIFRKFIFSFLFDSYLMQLFVYRIFEMEDWIKSSEENTFNFYFVLTTIFLLLFGLELDSYFILNFGFLAFLRACYLRFKVLFLNPDYNGHFKGLEKDTDLTWSSVLCAISAFCRNKYGKDIPNRLPPGSEAKSFQKAFSPNLMGGKHFSSGPLRDIFTQFSSKYGILAGVLTATLGKIAVDVSVAAIESNADVEKTRIQSNADVENTKTKSNGAGEVARVQGQAQVEVAKVKAKEDTYSKKGEARPSFGLKIFSNLFKVKKAVGLSEEQKANLRVILDEKELEAEVLRKRSEASNPNSVNLDALEN